MNQTHKKILNYTVNTVVLLVIGSCAAALSILATRNIANEQLKLQMKHCTDLGLEYSHSSERYNKAGTISKFVYCDENKPNVFTPGTEIRIK